MNCADFESRLNEELDATRTLQSADLAEHAAQCATCRAIWQRFRLLSDCIGAWRQETPDFDLAQAVVFALRQSADPAPQISRIESRLPTMTKQRRRQRSLPLAIAGAAAILIVAALLPVLRPGGRLTKPAAQVATVQGNLAISDEGRSDEDGSERARSQDDSGSTPQVIRRDPAPAEIDRVPYYNLAQRAAGALGQMTMLVLPSETTPQDPAQEAPAEGPAGWMDDFEHQLKPVGRSLGNAFDFLWRAGESVEG